MTIHVVGAGIAGMVAALTLARTGHRVCLHDAAAGAGGRCVVGPDGEDGDTHAMVGPKRSMLRFLDAIGARAGWVEPDPDGWRLLDLADQSLRHVALDPRGWRDPARRPAGCSAAGLLALAGMASGVTDRPVADVMAAHPALLRDYVEPLTIAALNTPVADASSARLGQVLRRMLRGDAAAPLVPRGGMVPDLVAPALLALQRADVTLRTREHLRAMTTAEGRIVALHLAQSTLSIEAEDAVILALPPWEVARLIPGLRVPERHAPIRTLHFAHAGEPGLRLVAVAGGVLHSVLLRPDGISARTRPAGSQVEVPPADLVPLAWSEIRAAARAVGAPGAWPDTPPPWRMSVTDRATPRHEVGFPPAAPRQPMRNLALAGDWTWPGLPATMEAAALSGEAAARAIARSRAARR